jgi:acetyl esterase/lipase
MFLKENIVIKLYNGGNVMKKVWITFVCSLILLNLFTGQISTGFKPNPPPTPPQQPPSGPGGSNYSHAGIIVHSYGVGALQYWIFEPTDPKPATAPLIVFNHGFWAMFPFWYQTWINHIVKRGNIVVYPRYQQTTILGIFHFYSNAITAVKNALIELEQGDHVKPELDHFAIVGHSYGGGITCDMAVLAESEGLPIPKAIMPVQAGFWLTNLSLIPGSILMIVVFGEDDPLVKEWMEKQIFYGADKIPLENKDFVTQITDKYGKPDLIADHSAPLTPTIPLAGFGKTDAMDYYSTWKLFDALTDYAFYGINRQYCFGNTSEQRFMGLWSDGTPVKELQVTDSP